jgi:hypothetical protein
MCFGFSGFLSFLIAIAGILSVSRDDPQMLPSAIFLLSHQFSRGLPKHALLSLFLMFKPCFIEDSRVQWK